VDQEVAGSSPVIRPKEFLMIAIKNLVKNFENFRWKSSHEKEMKHMTLMSSETIPKAYFRH
jgi:hypothetical protein